MLEELEALKTQINGLKVQQQDIDFSIKQILSKFGKLQEQLEINKQMFINNYNKFKNTTMNNVQDCKKNVEELKKKNKEFKKNVDFNYENTPRTQKERE